jgi:hypothetical protein
MVVLDTVSPPSTPAPSRFVALVSELLRNGHEVRVPCTGPSMLPTVRSGEWVVCEPIQPAKVRVGDVILFRRRNRIVMHRVLMCNGRGPGTRFLTRGDSVRKLDEPVLPADVLGRAIAVERAGRRLELVGLRGKILRTVRVPASRLLRRVYRYARHHLGHFGLLARRKS